MMSDATVHSRSRGIVIFCDTTCLVWEQDDGNAVIAWANAFDTAKNAYAKAHGGFYHAVVYQLINMEVIFDTDH